MSNLTQTIKDIKNLKIQGATNIMTASIKAWQDYLRALKIKSVAGYLQEAKKIAVLLDRARPDEPLTVNAFEILYSKLAAAGNIKARQPDILAIKKITGQAVADWLAELTERKQKISALGAKLIKNNDNIFTHCHSRTVLDILIAAKQQGKRFHVYNDETRPLWQGRITSKELTDSGIKNTMVVDSAAAFVVSELSGDEIKINKVIMGFDVLLPDGSAYNKIGSFSVALAAHTSGIPVYLAGTIMKKSAKKLPIELRDEREVWADKPKQLKIINYAFCHIPVKFITGYITEYGVLGAKEVIKIGMRVKN